jgi:tetrahydromethanopterin S-methyltransferase subunit F
VRATARAIAARRRLAAAVIAAATAGLLAAIGMFVAKVLISIASVS